MAEFGTWIEQECREAQVITWVVDHMEYYSSLDGNTKLLDDLKRYGQNIYTYTTEASRTYKEIYKKCCCNPIMQNSPFLLKKYSFICKEEKGRLIGVSINQKNYVVPIGLLETAPKECYGMVIKIKHAAEEEWKQEYRRTCEKTMETLEKTENKCRARRIEVNGTYQVSDLMLANTRNVLLSRGIVGIFCLIVMFRWKFEWINVQMNSLAFAYVCLMTALLCGFSMNLEKKIRNNEYNDRLSKKLEDMENRLNQYRKEVAVSSDTDKELNYVIYRCKEFIDFAGIENALVQADVVMKEQVKSACTEEKLMKAKRNLIIVLSCIVFSMLIAFLMELNGVIGDAQTEANYQSEDIETESNNSIFDKNGFIFPDSDVRYLTEEEVYALRNSEEYDFQTLLGYARNELYARHGFAFNENKQYYPFYMQYEWYRNMEHSIISDSVFNQYELANRDLIVEIERREGYRQ